jgi:hypothetical protein
MTSLAESSSPANVVTPMTGGFKRKAIVGIDRRADKSSRLNRCGEGFIVRSDSERERAGRVLRSIAAVWILA